MQNEYNHPAAQMARLREAGLNPALVYGQGASGATGLADQPKPTPFEFENPLRSMTAFQDVKLRKQQTDNAREHGNVLFQEAVLKAEQQSKTAMETARSNFDLNLAHDLRETSMEAAKLNVEKMKREILGKDLDNQFKSQTIKDRVMDVYFRSKNAQQVLKGNRLLNQLRILERDLKQIGIERNDPWYFRIFGRNWDLINKTLQK